MVSLEVRSENVLEAFIERIRRVDKLINAVADERFSHALTTARRLDEELEHHHGKKDELLSRKPFYGVPFTVKESVAVEGGSGYRCAILQPAQLIGFMFGLDPRGIFHAHFRSRFL